MCAAKVQTAGSCHLRREPGEFNLGEIRQGCVDNKQRSVSAT
jgi:hypothetical protein